jgi:hypothetical protein
MNISTPHNGVDGYGSDPATGEQKTIDIDDERR